jgi:hypothetical protein
VIVVQVAAEKVRHARRGYAQLEQPVMGAETVVENEHVVAGFDDVARAHAPQRRRGSSGSKQSDPHVYLQQAAWARSNE